jgi:hypothetical protein
MTVERRPPNSKPEHDDEATVKMPKLPGADSSDEADDFDPEATVVREKNEDWESTVIRRIAPHVAAVQSAVGEEAYGENRFGWETEGLRRLAHEVQKVGA